MTNVVVLLSVDVVEVRDVCSVSVVERTEEKDASVEVPRNATVDVTVLSYVRKAVCVNL